MLPLNESAHRWRPLGDLRITKRRRGAAIRCSAWFDINPLHIIHPFKSATTIAHAASLPILYRFAAWANNSSVLTAVAQIEQTAAQNRREDGERDTTRHIRGSYENAAAGGPLSPTVHNSNENSRKATEHRSGVDALLSLSVPNLSNFVCCSPDPHGIQIVERSN